MRSWSSASTGVVGVRRGRGAFLAHLWPGPIHSEPARADTLSPAVGVSAQWKMPRVEDDALPVTGLEAGERARIDFEALEDPGASDDEDDN